MRLEINRSTDLALRAIRALADADGARVKRAMLAGEIGTTPEFLARVMAPLVRRAWVGSVPGRAGGYTLVVDPAGISVLDVIDAVEGVPPNDRCVLRGGPCDGAQPCALHEAWLPARDRLLEQLAKTPVGTPKRR